MQRITGQASWLDLAKLNPGITDQWIKKEDFFLSSLGINGENKISQRNRAEVKVPQSPKEKTIYTSTAAP